MTVVAGTISQRFSATGRMQTLTVPAGVTTVMIDGCGAAGGNSGVAGAAGAHVMDAFTVVPGTTLSILVGGKGADAPGAGAGGGGGTFVFSGDIDQTTLLIAAGGGGGAGADPSPAPSAGLGVPSGGSVAAGGSPGYNGNGGGSSWNTDTSGALSGSGGGGLFEGGVPTVQVPSGGESILSGAAGGPGQAPNGGSGGFGGGGGGGGTQGGGGGGGGYSGGGGGQAPVRSQHLGSGGGGAGGGSFNANKTFDNDASTTLPLDAQGGDGWVVISYIDPADGPGSGPQVNILPALPAPPPGFQTQGVDDDAWPIGTPMQFQVDTTGLIGTVRDTEWIIPDTIEFLSDYIQTAAAGTPVPLTNTTMAGDKPLPAIPAATGRHNYSVQIHITGSNGNSTVVDDGWFYITAPTASITGRNASTVKVVKDPTGIVRLQFGDPYTLGRPGITFNVNATAPGRASGAIGVIQLMKGYRKITGFDGSVINATTGDNWFLDTQIPYAANKSAIADRGQCTLNFNDSPGTPLKPEIQAIDVNETYRAWVMYQYRGDLGTATAKWMPLGYVEWFWKGTISRVNKTDPWPDRPAASDQTYVLNINYVASTVPPSWAGNVTALRAQIAKVYGAVPELPSVDWLGNIADARQMLITISGKPTDDLTAKLRTVLTCPIAPPLTSPAGYLAWCTPAQAKAALGVTGVTSVDELPVAMRYAPAKTPGMVDTLNAATKFSVLVAPFCFYTDSGSQADVAVTAPLTSQQVADALVALAAANGHPNATATVGTDQSVALTFPTAPGMEIVPLLAAHAQVDFIEMTSSYTFDDPIPPDRPTT